MEIYKKLAASIENKEGVTLITVTKVVPEPSSRSVRDSYADLPGSKALVWADRRFYSERCWPKELKHSVEKHAVRALGKKESQTFTVNWDEWEVEYFVEVFPAPLHLIVAGAGHVAKPVVQIGKMVGFEVTVVCDRPEFANEAQFPWADEVICTPYLDYFRSFHPDDNTYILLLTRGHRFDVLILHELLRRSVRGYIGMIGSRRRISGVFSQLKKDLPDESFDHIHSPVGLDIGAQTPEEIAVSIVGEILQVKNNKSGKPLREVVKYFIMKEK